MSARIMWRQDGKIVSYVYHLDQKGNYGEDFVWTKEFGNPLHFRVNQWEKIKFTVKLNSMKKEDGSIIGYINGIPAIRVLNLRFRITEHLKIDHLCFNTFYGGSDQTWAPHKEQKLFIRGLRLTDASNSKIISLGVPSLKKSRHCAKLFLPNFQSTLFAFIFILKDFQHIS